MSKNGSIAVDVNPHLFLFPLLLSWSGNGFRGKSFKFVNAIT